MDLAVLLSADLRGWIGFGVTIETLMLKAAVGRYQEKQAADVAASLNGDIIMSCTVARSGQKEATFARKVMLSDIVCLAHRSTTNVSD